MGKKLEREKEMCVSVKACYERTVLFLFLELGGVRNWYSEEEEEYVSGHLLVKN